MPGIGECRPKRGSNPLGRGCDTTSRRLQDGAVLALGGSKEHTQLSRPFLAGAEAPKRAERECITAQGFLSRCLDKQRVKSSCNLREHTVHSLAKDFSLLTEGQLILTGLKWSHKKSRAYSGSKGQIPTGHAAVHVPYLTQESNQYKSAVAQQFAATSRVLSSRFS